MISQIQKAKIESKIKKSFCMKRTFSGQVMKALKAYLIEHLFYILRFRAKFVSALSLQTLVFGWDQYIMLRNILGVCTSCHCYQSKSPVVMTICVNVCPVTFLNANHFNLSFEMTPF